MANKPTILLFHTEPDKTKAIETICRFMKVQTVKVKMSSYAQPLGYLAGITGFHRQNTPYTGQEFPSEMLVFSGMDSDMVDTFLEKYKSTSLPPVRLKAILTQHNIFWTAEQLYGELFREHQSIRTL